MKWHLPRVLVSRVDRQRSPSSRPSWARVVLSSPYHIHCSLNQALCVSQIASVEACGPHAVIIKRKHPEWPLWSPGSKWPRGQGSQSRGPERRCHLPVCPVRPRTWRSADRAPLPDWTSAGAACRSHLCLPGSRGPRALNKQEVWKQNQSKGGAYHSSPRSFGSFTPQVPVQVHSTSPVGRACRRPLKAGRATEMGGHQAPYPRSHQIRKKQRRPGSQESLAEAWKLTDPLSESKGLSASYRWRNSQSKRMC